MALYIALNEVYYGKTRNLLEAEKLLADIKKDYDEDYYSGPSKVNVDQRWIRFCRLLADEFGLKELYIECLASKQVNAYTYPISLAIDCLPSARIKNNLLIDTKKMKFKESAGYIIMTFIYSGMLLNPLYTTGEIMAIILHEIGHNFQTVIDKNMFFLSDAIYITRMISAILQYISMGNLYGAAQIATQPITQSMLVRNIKIKLNKVVDRITFFQIFNLVANNILGRYKDLMANISQVVGAGMGYASLLFPAIPLQVVINGIVGTILNPLGYRGEKIADNFATIYGYGPELSSGLMKGETDASSLLAVDKYTKGTIVGSILRNGYGIMSVLIGLFDVHPNTVERCLDQIRYLEQEISTSKELSPRAKTVLKDQIKEIRKNLEEVMNNPDLDEHWNEISYSVATLIYNDGGDTRHKYMGKDVHANIQKTYDDAIRKLK